MLTITHRSIFVLQEDLREEVERYKRKLAAASHGGSGSGGPVVAVGVGPRRSVIGGGGRPSVLPPRPRTSLSGNIDFLQLLAQPGGGEGGEGSGDEDSGMSKGASRIAALEAKLAESESSNKSLLARLAKATAEAEAASRLRDELDVLRPLAAAKDKAEAAAERLKKKVDGIPELKAQIKRLEDKNQELVSQVLSLEREVAQIPPLRDTLEAAQDAKCASDIRCSELEAALAEAQATCEELRSALSTASDSNHAGASTDWAPASIGSAQLAELLQQQPADAASEAGAGSGSTTGMNEFNPELAEKMARLERENADLKACVSGGSGERVTKLERDLEDLRRMKVAFEGKFHQSKTKAAELEKQLADANAQIAQLQSELAARNTELTNGKREQAELEESLTALQRGAQQLKAQLASVKTAHADDKQTWTTQRDQLTTQLERERAAHSATQQAHLAEVASMQGAHAAALQEAKDELQRRLQAVQAELARNNNAAEAALASKDADHSALMRSVERRHADAVSRLEDELQDIKRAADDRYRQLSQSSAEREASLQRELDAYREAHSVSDKEYLGKIATLQEQAASLQSKITTLEALKEKGTMYVQQLQLEIQDKVAALEEQAAVACDQQAAAEEYAARYADALRRLEMEEDSCRTLRMEYDELQAMLKKTRKEARSRQDGDLELATVCKGLETEVQTLTADKRTLTARCDALVTYMRGTGCAVPACLMQGALPAGFGETGTAASAGATAAEEGASAATGTRRGGARRVKAAATIDHERSIAEQLVHLESQLLQLQEERNKALANQSEALRQRNDMESERDDLADKIEKLEAECTRCKLTAQRLALRLESLGDSLPAEMGGEERTVLVVGGGAGENTEELPAAYGAHGSGDGDEEDDDEFTANAADFFSQQSKPTTAPAFAHAAEVLASSGVRAASTALAPKQSTAAVGVGPRMSIANSKMWEKAAAAARVPRSGAGGVSGGTGL